MADVDLSLIGKLEEVTETLNFRNKASVKIRKIKREKAFSQAVDIVIQSVSYNLYQNFKAQPPIQFYGYATLVFQDSTEISIPIVSPRQRLYYGFQYEAFRQWRHWIEFYQLYQLHRFNDISLASIMGALQIPYEEKKPELKENGWIELPLREVYIKLQDGTQFKLEFTQWQPIKFTDPINQVDVDGKSNQEDGDKDNGLPKDGIQPKQNPSTNPFFGNNSTTGLESAGLKGFDLIDDSSLNNPNPDNGLTPDDDASFGFFLRVETLGRYINFGEGELVEGLFYFLVADGTTGVNETNVQQGDSAAGFSSVWEVVGIPSGDIIGSTFAYASATFSIIRSANLPTDGYFRVI